MTDSVIINATVIGCAISGLVLSFGLIRIIVVAIIDAKNIRRISKDTTKEHISAFTAEAPAKMVEFVCSEPPVSIDTTFSYHTETNPDLIENFRKSWLKITEETDREEQHNKR